MSAARRHILHVDMDAFFVSVELLERPELRGRPVVVGGTGPRGVVAAASYEARAFGVHSAMPSAVARRLCPQALFLDGRHERYREVSAVVMDIFGSITPLVEPLSLDEAFLDVSGRVRALGPAPGIAATIRRRVLDEVGLTCSVGVAHNKFLAKLATETAKPRATPTGPVFGSGVAVVDPDDVEAFLWPLAASDLWGVGPATLAKLERLGVATVGDIARLPLDALCRAVGNASGTQLHRLSHGLDDRPVEPGQVAKSISHEETFPTDVTDRARLEREVVRLADAVADRLRRAGSYARTVQLKLRHGTFQTLTRSSTLPAGTDDGIEIARIARTMLDGIDVSGGVRLLGVGVSGLAEAEHRAEQLSLLDDAGAAPPDGAASPTVDRRRLNEAVDEIRDRFGRASIGPATLARPDVGAFVEGQQQWGPTGPDDRDAAGSDRR
ncbi:MAG: DNA polymerase IV [Microthrixaceae bacterium]